MKKLPIGISTFSQIIQENYTYVDKTRFVHELTEQGKYFFLSRPRRFGKTLFIDTLKEAFEGNRNLFKDLWLEDHWDWDQKYPVIHFSLGLGVPKTRDELDGRLRDLLLKNQAYLGIACRDPHDIAGCFSELIRKAAAGFRRRAVVLIDEYDKPILDNITNPDQAAEIREGLKNFYSVIKESDPHIQFVMLTGVSKFSKVSLFSGLNNLIDITIDSRFSTICGYTDSEMRDVFASFLVGKNLEEIRRWYNGYSWLGEAVYNPFSILNFLSQGSFRNYWFETGTPEFLVKLFRQKRYFVPQAEHIEAYEAMFGSFDLDYIEPENLLFQTGYLTIKNIRPGIFEPTYELSYPNYEVKKSLTESILHRYCGSQIDVHRNRHQLEQNLSANDIQGMRSTFQAFFASIPHDWYRKNQLAAYEGYYASIFYCYFTALGLDVTAEDTTNHGRIDMTVKLNNRVYIFEFKVISIDATPGSALRQIKNKKYAQKYQDAAEEVYLIGVEFDPEERNIVEFEWETVFRE